MFSEELKGSPTIAKSFVFAGCVVLQEYVYVYGFKNAVTVFIDVVFGHFSDFHVLPFRIFPIVVGSTLYFFARVYVLILDVLANITSSSVSLALYFDCFFGCLPFATMSRILSDAEPMKR